VRYALAVVVVVASCSGRLDGRHHRATTTIVGIPIEISRRDLPILTGELVVECGPVLLPATYRTIVVEAAGKEILQTTTDSSGRFRVSVDLPSGQYRVRVSDPQLTGHTVIRVGVNPFDIDYARIIAKCASRPAAEAKSA